jgi:hypothetical protein
VVMAVPGVVTVSMRVAHCAQDARTILLQHLDRNAPGARATRSHGHENWPRRMSGLWKYPRRARQRCTASLVEGPFDAIAITTASPRPRGRPARGRRFSLCVPKISSTSCDQAVFVDQAADASLSSDVVLVEVGRFG